MKRLLDALPKWLDALEPAIEASAVEIHRRLREIAIRRPGAWHPRAIVTAPPAQANRSSNASGGFHW
jgi:hypothetical protein